MAITLEQIHDEIISLKHEVEGLKECIHEDALQLSEETKRDIEESRKALREGKGVSLEEVEKRLNVER